MKILLTGSSGYLGSAILKTLAQRRNFKITTIDRIYDAKFAHFKQIIGDLNERRTYSQIKEVIFDLIIHVAGYVPKTVEDDREEKCEKGNVAATVHLLKNIKCKKFLYISTCEVYGYQKDFKKIISEKNLPNPLSNYAKSKAMAEKCCTELCADRNIDLCILRMATIIGAGDFIDRAIPNFISAALKGINLRITGNGRQERDYLYIIDAAQAIALAANSFFPGLYNVSSGRGVSISSAAGLIKELTGAKSKIIYLNPKSLVNNSTAKIIFDNTKFKKQFGFTVKFALPAAIREIIKLQRCIIFDLDGTLINTDERLFQLHVYAAKKMHISHLRRGQYLELKHNGISEKNILKKMGTRKNIFLDYQKKRMELIESSAFLKYDRLKSGVRELLKFLSSTHTLVLLTKRKETRNCFLELKRCKIDSFFKQIMIEPRSKTEAIKNFFYSNSFIVSAIVGDTEEDAAVAQANHLRLILVSDGFRSKNFLTKLHRPVVIEKIKDLKFCKL